MSLFDILAILGKVAFVLAVVLGSVPLIVWFERRGSAWIQGRVGPNRVGPFGLFQPFVDVVKFATKENFVPRDSSKVYYHLAPALAVVAPLAAFAVIPFGSQIIVMGQAIQLQITQLDIGILAILAFAGLEIYPVMLAGWSSNNKYGVFGALRGSSQMMSYEIAFGLSLASMLLVYGTFDLNEMVRYQQNTFFGFLPKWGILLNPLSFLIFLIAIFVETNRLPFDLPEGDSELVAGYHIEYGATKFMMFFFAEYVAMIMASSVLVTLFLGGYATLPGVGLLIHTLGISLDLTSDNQQNLLALGQVTSFIFKVALIMIFYVWVRWTLPRFRFDQLMNLGWKILFPLSLINLMFVASFLAWIGG